MNRWQFRKWGFRANRLHVTWYDLWAKEFCWEVYWDKRDKSDRKAK